MGTNMVRLSLTLLRWVRYHKNQFLGCSKCLNRSCTLLFLQAKKRQRSHSPIPSPSRKASPKYHTRPRSASPTVSAPTTKPHQDTARQEDTGKDPRLEKVRHVVKLYHRKTKTGEIGGLLFNVQYGTIDCCTIVQ